MTTLADLEEKPTIKPTGVTTTSAQPASLDPLYSRNPGSVNASSGMIGQAAAATAAQVGKTPEAKATGFDAFTQSVPDAELASSQLNKITSQESPLIKRARQQGLTLANNRGLINSSIAAGAAEGAMVDRATPLAQQDAAIFQGQRLQNQADINRSREVSTGRETDVSQFNANIEAERNRLQAQLETAVSQGNAELANSVRIRQAELDTQVNSQNAEAANRFREQVLQQNAELNKQFLANTGAIDLANIQGRYETLISSNQSASNLYNAFFGSIAQLMANKDIPPDRVAQSLQVQQSLLESGLRLIDQLNGLNLGDATRTPSIVTSGSGSGTAITAVPFGASPGSTPVAQGTVPVGNANLPPGTTTKQITGKPGGAGIYQVFDASGKQIGILKPGGDKGIYVPNAR